MLEFKYDTQVLIEGTDLDEDKISDYFTENFKGAFPFWLSPFQVGIVPIREEHNEYARKVVDLLTENNIRVEADYSDSNMKEKIKAKDSNLVGNMTSQGTTPRQLTDLLGSLCDLTSGSGDRGTPVILIQNYFTNYATE